MTRTYHKVGDNVYYEDSDNPGVYRKISGYDALNAPSNAIQVGSNLYNTPENIEELKKAEQYFKKQEEEQKKKEQAEASKSYAQRQAEAQAQVKPVPHVTSPEYSRYVNRIEELKDQGVNASTAVDIATSEYAEKQKQSENTAKKIADVIASTVATNVIGKILDKVKKKTIEDDVAQTQKKSMPVPPVDIYRIPAYLKYLGYLKDGWNTETSLYRVVSEYNLSYPYKILNEPAVQEALSIIKETTGAPSLRQNRLNELYDQEMKKYLTQKQDYQKIAIPISSNEANKYIAIAWAGGLANIIVKVGSSLWNFITKNPKVVGGTISTTALSQAITQTAQTEQEKMQIIKDIAEQHPQLAQEITRSQTNPFTSISDTGKYIVLGIIGMLLLYLLSKK